MGRFVVSALAGAAGAILFVACGGTGPAEISANPPDAQPSSVDRSDSTDATRDVSESGSLGDGAIADAAAADADSSVHADASDASNVTDSSSTSDAADGSDASSTPSTFRMPAILHEDGCWQDEFPNPVCKPVPKTSPPIVDWGSCTPPAGTGYGQMHMATLRIPPRSCLRVDGRWEPSKMSSETCVEANCSASSIACKITKNNSATEDAYVRVHYKRKACSGDFTAWWYAIEDCPSFPSCN